jgi:2-C-methyl-D-erythritol 4-phosphate cytidylyltransferase/2-C-methyl-D-erythritol 2,4-cyclodiphosphate synthase
MIHNGNSERFLEFANKLANQAGYQVSNVDITLICEAPKVKPNREAMRARTADVLQISIDAVSVKATTTERLGFAGRREGMAGQAAVVLTPYEKSNLEATDVS